MNGLDKLFIIIQLSLIYSGCFYEKMSVNAPLNHKYSCKENIDSNYNRIEILSFMANTLNEQNPKYKRNLRREFNKHPFQYRISPNKIRVYNSRPFAFSVYDLIDTLNYNKEISGRCIDFINNHVYIFRTTWTKYISYYNIAILDNGKVNVFLAIGEENGSTIDDIKQFYITKDGYYEPELITKIEKYKHFIYGERRWW